MAKNKFYAIKIGTDPTTGNKVHNLLLESWADTEKFVKGISGAIYKGFPLRKDAEAFLDIKDPLFYKNNGDYPKEALHCYVDGSYNGKIPNYGFGLVCVKNEKIIYTENGVGNNHDAISMNQIGGELLGAMKGLLYARNNGFKSVVIFHDYKGTCYHATGFWERDSRFTEEYYQWMQRFFANIPKIEVVFCKVDAHIGDDFNELADGYAKMSIGLKPDPIFYRKKEKYGVK